MFSVLRPGNDSAGGGGELSERYRLAGTFLATGTIGAEAPVAILEEKATGRQRVVRPSDSLPGGVLVERITANEVVLSGPTGRTRLRFEASPETAGASAPSPAAETEDLAGYSEAFGARRVGESRWRFDREALLEYYDELRNEPQRLLAVFDSLKPVYEPEGTIRGYFLQIEGEENFFRAAGLNNGDIVRAVNHVPMTNRRRAEHFIRRFVEEGLDTVVLLVERDGEPVKLEYLIEGEPQGEPAP